MEKSYLEIINKRKQIEIADIKKCNEITKQYGLVLSDDKISNILERRKETLKETGRIEFREGIIDKLTKEFCDSPYIEFMKKSFDGICQGDLEYLSGTVMYRMRENLLRGKHIDYIEEGEDYE